MWKLRMRSFLRSHCDEMWECVTDGSYVPMSIPLEAGALSVPKPKEQWSEQEKEAVRLNTRAQNYLFQALDSNLLRNVGHLETAKEVWDALCVLMEGNDKVKIRKLDKLMTDFEFIKIGADETIVQFYQRFTTLVNEIRASG